MRYILGFFALSLISCSVLIRHFDDIKTIGYEIVDYEIDEIEEILTEDKND